MVAELPPLLKAQFDENIRSQLMKVQEPYQKIGMYISINDEADTRRILQHLLDQGKQIAVPKCVVREGQNTLDFYWIEGLEDCIPSRFELLEPWRSLKSGVVRAGADDRPGRRIRWRRTGSVTAKVIMTRC